LKGPWDNAYIAGGGTCTSGNPCGTYTANIDYCTASSNNGCEQTANNGNPAMSCTANKCSASFTAATAANFWADVARASIGDQLTPPNGVNFALCTAAGVPNAACTGASAALGYATSETYLPTWVRDAGACDHSLTSCP
jgi:hypothetical protein